MNALARSRTGLAVVLAGLLGILIGNATAPQRFPTRTFGSSSSAQIARVGSLTQLVLDARLIVIGEVSADLRILPVGAESGADWRQLVRIEEVLDGTVTGPVLDVVRVGMMPGHTTSDGAHAPAGPLTPGRSLLFLTNSAEPGVMEVVGHDVGEFPIRDGIVQAGRGPYPVDELEQRSLGDAVDAVRDAIGRVAP